MHDSPQLPSRTSSKRRQNQGFSWLWGRSYAPPRAGLQYPPPPLPPEDDDGRDEGDEEPLRPYTLVLAVMGVGIVACNAIERVWMVEAGSKRKWQQLERKAIFRCDECHDEPPELISLVGVAWIERAEHPRSGCDPLHEQFSRVIAKLDRGTIKPRDAHWSDEEVLVLSSHRIVNEVEYE